MNLPASYDAWRLAGPHDDEADTMCPSCFGDGYVFAKARGCDIQCHDCDGTGLIQDDSDDRGDWLLERQRDRMLDEEMENRK